MELRFLELEESCLDYFKYLGTLYDCDMRTCPQVNAEDIIPQITIQFVLPAFKSANLNIFFQ